MSEEEIKKLQQEKEEALSREKALQDELNKEKESKAELQAKYDKLVVDSDQLRLLNGPYIFATLFTKAKIWKQSMFRLLDKWIKKK